MWRIASVFSILRRFLSHSLDRLGVHSLGLRLRLLVFIKADDNVISHLQVLKADFLRFAGVGIVRESAAFEQSAVPCSPNTVVSPASRTVIV